MNYIKDAIKYPYITQLINDGGGLNIEYTREMGIVVIAFDEGGTIWEGEKFYENIESLLEDAENGIKKWIDDNW